MAGVARAPARQQGLPTSTGQSAAAPRGDLPVPSSTTVRPTERAKTGAGDCFAGLSRFAFDAQPSRRSTLERPTAHGVPEGPRRHRDAAAATRAKSIEEDEARFQPAALEPSQARDCSCRYDWSFVDLPVEWTVRHHSQYPAVFRHHRRYDPPTSDRFCPAEL